ncbi:hypothetical protein H0X91_25320 [Burkholderia sp. 9777_1386]|uniref:hypothetical protein n=1 Tax=Burkholderia sp. 9777_1386 TaxID=2751183 RepID=UPI0018C40876|nr:hypothetical protein [Burkholderia sp. 9777_1386]
MHMPHRFACAIARRVALTSVRPLPQQRVGNLDRLAANRRRKISHRRRITLIIPRHI